MCHLLTDWPGQPSCFSDRPKKHKLGRGHWDLSSYQVSLQAVQQFQRRSWKCLSQSEARVAILLFRSAEKHKLGRGRWNLASCQIQQIPFSGFREVENVSANQKPGQPSCFSDRPEKHKLHRGPWDISSSLVSLISVQQFRRSRKISQPIRGQGGHLVFPIGQKNKNLEEDVEIFLPVKFPWIPFSAKYLSQSEARAAILFLRSAQKTQTW